MNAVICKAISEMKLVVFNYEGGDRTVEPHCFGVTTAGNPGLRGYQVVGYSSSGEMGWKMFDMSKASSLRILDQTFNGPRSGYNANDKGMRSIECAL